MNHTKYFLGFFIKLKSKWTMPLWAGIRSKVQTKTELSGLTGFLRSYLKVFTGIKKKKWKKNFFLRSEKFFFFWHFLKKKISHSLISQTISLLSTFAWTWEINFLVNDANDNALWPYYSEIGVGSRWSWESLKIVEKNK